MIDLWIALPLTLRFVLLAIAGLLAGVFVNWAVYAFAWFPLPISPWSKRPEAVDQRSWPTRLPLFGWWARGAELSVQRELAAARLRRLGYDVPEEWRPRLPFWFRPLLIEIGMTAALPGLYWFETQSGSLLPMPWQAPAEIARLAPWTNWLFFGHALLLVLMTVATFIDFDEQTVPDAITVPGTIFGVIWGSISLASFLPCEIAGRLYPCTMNLPWPWAAKWGETPGLVLALALWTGWCFALSNRRVILRRGWRKGVQYFFAALVRPPGWKILLTIGLMGAIGIVSLWAFAGPTHRQGLLTSLVGMAVGGGTVWAVRLVAGVAMGEEAMGFGDVTLMGMIGAFIGWQASLLAFFLAPMAAIAIFVIQRILTGERAQAFGPYLCVGSAATIFWWPGLWSTVLLPNLNGLTLAVLAVCLVLMGILLAIWRLLKGWMLGGR